MIMFDLLYGWQFVLLVNVYTRIRTTHLVCHLTNDWYIWQESGNVYNAYKLDILDYYV